MAFFNVTQLGVQDPIKVSMKEDKDIEATYVDKKVNTKTDVSTERKTAIKLQSFDEFNDKRRRHERPFLGPKEVYEKPVTASQDYGWFIDKDLNEKESWTRTKRHVHVNSEMTKFVKSMTLTNRDFSLF